MSLLPTSGTLQYNVDLYQIVLNSTAYPSAEWLLVGEGGHLRMSAGKVFNQRGDTHAIASDLQL